MILQSAGPETRLQRALRLLAESRALLEQNEADLRTLAKLGHCIRAATATNCDLREKVAQDRRDVIRAQDRIRFDLDEAGMEPSIVSATSHAIVRARTRTDDRTPVQAAQSPSHVMMTAAIGA